MRAHDRLVSDFGPTTTCGLTVITDTSHPPQEAALSGQRYKEERMRISKIHLAVVLLAPIAFGATAWAQRAGQSVAIKHGIVTDARSVNLEGEAGRGALVGGLAGAALSGNRSSSTRARNAILSTAAGAAVSGSQRRSGMQFTVDTGGGTVTIVSDQREIAVGDCVAVENAGTGSANIRRASSALCESPDVSAAT